MFSIQNKHLPLHSGYYQGSSQLYLRNIWLKIKEEERGHSLSLISNKVGGGRSIIKLLIDNRLLDKMQKRFLNGQRDFQICAQKSGHHKIFKLLFSNHALKLVNGREKLTDILGLNFKKIGELHEGKPDFKYEPFLRCFSCISSLNPYCQFAIVLAVAHIFVKTLQMGSQAVDNSWLIGTALLTLFLPRIQRPDLIPAINKGPSIRGINCTVGNQYFSCFHIQDNIITVYKNPLYYKIISQFDEIIKELVKGYHEKGIDLKMRLIMPSHEEHEYLHNFSDLSRLPARGHFHMQFSGIPVITPEIFHAFITRLTSQNLIDADVAKSIMKKFKQTVLK